MQSPLSEYFQKKNNFFSIWLFSIIYYYILYNVKFNINYQSLFQKFKFSFLIVLAIIIELKESTRKSQTSTKPQKRKGWETLNFKIFRKVLAFKAFLDPVIICTILWKFEWFWKQTNKYWWKHNLLAKKIFISIFSPIETHFLWSCIF